MESWVETIGIAPIASVIAGLCAVIAWMGRYITAQHEAYITDQKEMLRQVSSALSANATAMSASAAALSSAREAMQVATAVMERSAR